MGDAAAASVTDDDFLDDDLFNVLHTTMTAKGKPRHLAKTATTAVRKGKKAPAGIRRAKSDDAGATGNAGMKRKLASWMVSSFDASSLSSQPSTLSQPASGKRRSPNASQAACTPPSATEQPWIDVYKPERKGDLAIHKKKIEEVETWLRNHINVGSVLLLTGPSGCGKCTCLRVLCKEIGLRVHEWVNPVNRVAQYLADTSFGESQTSQFRNFLVRANKYRSLNIFDEDDDNDDGGESGLRKRLVLIKDLPGVCYRDATVLQETLSWYLGCGKCPLVLVSSDSQHGACNIHKLLPHAFLQRHSHHSIQHISFNPVANTNMVRVLNSVISAVVVVAGVPSSRRAIPAAAPR